MVDANFVMGAIGGSLCIIFVLIRIVFWAYMKCIRNGNQGSEKVESDWVSWLILLSFASTAAWAIFLNIIVFTPNPALAWVRYTFFPHTSDLAVTIAEAISLPFLAAADVLFALVHWHLGNSWSGLVRKLENHELKTTGPYQFARHPMYTSIFLLWIGVTLLTLNWVLSLLLLINCIVAAGRIRIEERLMLKLFGEKYFEFMKGRGAFVPWRIFDCGVPLEEAQESLGLVATNVQQEGIQSMV